MRLDKFLKVSRIIKRRTLAKEISDNSRVTVNNKIAKSSTKVKIGDIISIKFGNKIVTIEIIKILDSTKKEDSSSMYKILNEEYND